MIMLTGNDTGRQPFQIARHTKMDQDIASGQMDLVMVGRAHLANPHWPYAAALQLKADRPSWLLPAPYAHWLERYALLS